MTRASRPSPEVHLVLQCLIRNFSRIENVVSVGLTKSIHRLPPVEYADSGARVHYDSDVNPGFHYYAAECTALNICDIIGPAQARIIQCLKFTKPQAGFDQDMTQLGELADAPTQDKDAGEAP
eukprot:5410254-Pyramimonas_sp.AAC.1